MISERHLRFVQQPWPIFKHKSKKVIFKVTASRIGGFGAAGRPLIPSRTAQEHVHVLRCFIYTT